MAEVRQSSELSDDDQQCVETVHESNIPTGKRENTLGEHRRVLDTDSDGYWHCSHTAEDGEERCIFHLPPNQTNKNEASDRLINLINKTEQLDTRQDQKRQRQFIGAQFDSLILDDQIIEGDNNLPIDLRLMSASNMSCDNAAINPPLDIRDSDIDNFRFRHGYCDRIYAQESNFSTVELDHTEITRAYFERTTADLTRLYFASIDYGNFHQCEYTHLNGIYGVFGEIGMFNSNIDLLAFYRSDFNNLYMNNATLGYLNLRQTSGDFLILRDADITGVSAIASEWNLVRLNECEFDRLKARNVEWSKVTGTGAQFGVAEITNSHIQKLLLGEVVLGAATSLEDTNITDEISLNPIIGDNTTYVSLQGASLAGGQITVPTKNIIYDFDSAEVGDIVFRSNSDIDVLQQVEFIATEFEHFDFSEESGIKFKEHDYCIHVVRSGLRADIQLGQYVLEEGREVHPAVDKGKLYPQGVDNEIEFEKIDTDLLEVDGESVAYRQATEAQQANDQVEPVSYRRIEKTYVEAKTGADKNGDTHAAGQFFEKEYVYRRKGYQAAFRDPDLGIITRATRFSQWGRSCLLALTSGYGEKPWRVFGSSTLIILVFTIWYQIRGLSQNEDLLSASLENFIFSIQSFVALIVGPPAQNPDITIRASSALEGFVGAFLIALFVFTLTRKIHR